MPIVEFIYKLSHYEVITREDITDLFLTKGYALTSSETNPNYGTTVLRFWKSCEHDETRGARKRKFCN